MKFSVIININWVMYLHYCYWKDQPNSQKPIVNFPYAQWPLLYSAYSLNFSRFYFQTLSRNEKATSSCFQTWERIKTMLFVIKEKKYIFVGIDFLHESLKEQIRMRHELFMRSRNIYSIGSLSVSPWEIWVYEYTCNIAYFYL